MNRCVVNCVMGQCHQNAYDDDYCFYHLKLRGGTITAVEDYGVDLFDE